MAKQRKEVKELVFVIEYRVPPEDSGWISEIIDKMRETGGAEILDVRVEQVKASP